MNRLKLALENPALAWRWISRRGSNLTDIEPREIKRFMKEQGAIIEAGASDGNDTARLAKSFVRNQIYALEPIKNQFETTLVATQSLENVEVGNLALSTTNGLTKMFVGKSGLGISGMGSSSLLKPKLHLFEFPEISFSGREEVQTITLEDFCARKNITYIDLLWLDVQGFEMNLIFHGREFIQEYVNLVHMEVSRVELYEGTRLYRDVMQDMRSLGFKARLRRVGRVSGNCLFQNNRFK